MKSNSEYDFRFSGLIRNGHTEPAFKVRVRRVRDVLLGVAAGFTEIAPGALTDLVPGEGLGYIAALKSREQACSLQTNLRRLARIWNVPPPALIKASDGPRSDFSFVLIPELANEVLPSGRRRNLFSPERWAEIQGAIVPKLSRPVEFVYGEWAPSGVERVIPDVLRMYVVRSRSEAEDVFLERFVQTRVFDGGRSCDQRAIYLSARGKARLVMEARRRGNA
ncbi:MAG: hypothetical protein WC712_15265 [Candidatus Brocadiia bacterium]